MVKYDIAFIKTFFMFCLIAYTFCRITEINKVKVKQNIFIIITNICIALLYAILRNQTTLVICTILCYYSYIIIWSTIIHEGIFKSIIIGTISMFFSYIVFVISSMIVYTVINLINIKIEKTYEIVEYIFIGIFQFILINLFFKIKRFKNGFNFLKKNNINNLANIIMAIISFLVIMMCIFIGMYNNNSIKNILLSFIIVDTIFIMFAIKKSITNYYKKRLKDRTVETQAEQLKEKDEKIAELQTELAGVLKINHKYNQRLSAMEEAVKKLGERINFNEEFANEYADVINSVNEFSKEYKSELAKINKDELPKTNIYSIDNLLEFLNKEANSANIKFKLQVNGNINEMIEGFIQKNKLETLLADHIRDAIIAIKSGNNEKREILLNLGKNGEFYEVNIQDTGIEFEIDTLLKLGKEQVTTHKDEGGSGIGFVTTFETIRECKASLIIKENHPQSRYTKAVMIRFDGKNEYRISSYRASMIKEKNQDGRIIID